MKNPLAQVEAAPRLGWPLVGFGGLEEARSLRLVGQRAPARPTRFEHHPVAQVSLSSLRRLSGMGSSPRRNSSMLLRPRRPRAVASSQPASISALICSLIVPGEP